VYILVGKREKNWIVERAHNSVKSILERKLELGQITEEQLQEITLDLDENGVLPEYCGKLYEYVGAMPIEYIGKEIKKYREIIGSKLPEQITSEDIEILTKAKLNERELYYFFIKMGASKELLDEISGANKIISHQSVIKATDDVTIGEFCEATQDLIASDKLRRGEIVKEKKEDPSVGT